MYLATLHPDGGLIKLRMAPMQIRQMRLNRPTPGDVRWLADTLGRINMTFGTWVEEAEGSLYVRWR